MAKKMAKKMAKSIEKSVKKSENIIKSKNIINKLIHSDKDVHPILKQKLNLGQKAADAITKFGGSWTFIFFFLAFLLVWMGLNFWAVIVKPFDPYPFILLNLVLSCLAAVQAPIILMSQNRQAERDRLDAKYDYAVNRKAERENRLIINDLEEIKKILKSLKKK